MLLISRGKNILSGLLINADGFDYASAVSYPSAVIGSGSAASKYYSQGKYVADVKSNYASVPLFNQNKTKDCFFEFKVVPHGANYFKVVVTTKAAYSTAVGLDTGGGGLQLGVWYGVSYQVSTGKFFIHTPSAPSGILLGTRLNGDLYLYLNGNTCSINRGQELGHTLYRPANYDWM